MLALLLPSLALAAALLAGVALLLVVRAVCLRGMGHRPMLTAGRAACPAASGATWPARPQSPFPPSSDSPCGVWRAARPSGSRAPADAKVPLTSFRALANGPAAGAAGCPSPAVRSSSRVPCSYS